MSNHVASILQQWHNARDDKNWVLGVVYQTQGPCYRKPGAIMLLSDSGDRLGLLSGGCLEADIQLHAKKVMHAGKPLVLSYDGSDEDDISFQLGIGCGGTVDIGLLPLSKSNDYHCLNKAYDALMQRETGVLTLAIPVHKATEYASFKLTDNQGFHGSANYYTDPDGIALLDIVIQRPPHVLVVGGGVDAIPVVSIASALGWEVTVWDSRPANARAEHFGKANTILTEDVENLGRYAAKQNVSGVFLLSHNVSLDAQALISLKESSLKYMALLGPATRRADVLSCAELTDDDIATPISGPAGLKLGGELPESIAMSILAECHEALYAQKATN